MIDFSVPADTQLLVDTVRRFVDHELLPLEDRVEADGQVAPDTARALRAKAVSLGLYAMNMPEEVGGGGLSAVDMCLVDEQLGRTSEALVRQTFGAVIGSLVHCVGPQRDKYLLPAVRGDIDISIAMTEPEAGSDAVAIKTTAVRDGDGYVLNGSKHFISGAQTADAFVVTAITGADTPGRGVSTFLVDRDTPGFTVGRVQHMMGVRGVSHNELFFGNVRLSEAQRLGPEGQGLQLALATLNRVRLGGVGARSVGLATRMLDECLQYARDRRQGGKPIAEHQLIQAKLADMASEIFAVRMMVLNTAWEIDQGIDPRAKVSIVKVRASEMLGMVTDHAVQIHGGMGYSKELGVERHYRDARVSRILDGTSEIHRLLIARTLLKQGVAAVH